MSTAVPSSPATRCVLIGGTGFIGTHLVRSLAATGRQVLVLDHHAPNSAVPGVDYVVGDYGERETLLPILRECDELIDLAYATRPNTSFDDPVFDLLSNVRPAVGLFQEALACPNLRKIVIVSSGGTVYGAVDSTPIREDAPTYPISPYGITKLTIEKYAFMFHQTRGLPVAVVRPSNAYGPGQRPFMGQGFVATAIGALLLGREIPVYGGGKTIRDYIYVEDLVRGIVAVLEHGQDGECYNLGSGEGRSNLEVLEALGVIAAERGLAARLAHQPARGFDVPANVLDIAKVTAATGWVPEFDFDTGLRLTWDAIEQSGVR